MGLPLGLGTLVIVVIALLLGADPQLILGLLEGAAAPPEPQVSAPADDADADFLSAVLADTEQTWQEVFAARSANYVEPTLVLFTGQVASACGYQSAAVGPFYCPRDGQVYIDLSFYQELERRFGAAGDFARAYVLAHEVGHHVQNLLGTSEAVARSRAGATPKESNRLSMLLELQADCYAGVWAHHAKTERQLLEPGDIEEGLGAAAAIGDDAIQRRSQGFVVPESFTHGTSEQRATWFSRGLEQGRIEACDTFGAR